MRANSWWNAAPVKSAHWKNGHLLWAVLLVVLAAAPAWAADDDEDKPPKEELIAQALEYHVSVDLAGVPLEGLLEYFADVLPDDQKISIVIARRKIAEAGIDVNHPVTLKVRDIRLRSALALALAETGLDWTIRDEVLLITTHEAAAENVVTRVYDVNDLVVQKGSDKAANFDELIEVIQSSVAPQSWGPENGPGSIRAFSTNGGRLVVRQTSQVHYDIAKLLEDLHATAQEAADEPKVAEDMPADAAGKPADKSADNAAKGGNTKQDADADDKAEDGKADDGKANDKESGTDARTTTDAKRMANEEMVCPRTKR